MATTRVNKTTAKYPGLVKADPSKDPIPDVLDLFSEGK